MGALLRWAVMAASPVQELLRPGGREPPGPGDPPPFERSRRAALVRGVLRAAAALAGTIAAVAGAAAAAVAPAPTAAALPVGTGRVPEGAASAVAGGQAALEAHYAALARCMLVAGSPFRPC